MEIRVYADAIKQMLKPLFPAITRANFYTYYLCLSVVPFNLLRCVLICILTFAVYKRLSRLIKRWIGEYGKTETKRVPAVKKDVASVLVKQYVPTMWTVLIVLSALVVAVIVGVWVCVK